eukprot:CAMPEP_0204195038 /NCGR_PEP_ID=MMETSP0361-20130328/62799_1 /ASSEMBLY_ACC=CAM_ASM_000343 /TAXON_ID=268821 /ORGANISM="Scrippsiella Hangoei, Strain SHTV-5" /LENGTH=252 /DNA_ID=CAMNT_0051156539 /DNA_START=59 /DNA_END=817 /DNA_ORIENTATION=+
MAPNLGTRRRMRSSLGAGACCLAVATLCWAASSGLPRPGAGFLAGEARGMLARHLQLRHGLSSSRSAALRRRAEAEGAVAVAAPAVAASEPAVEVEAEAAAESSEEGGEAASKPNTASVPNAVGKISVVKGATRYSVEFAADDTLDSFRGRVAELSGLPADKLELMTAGKEEIGSGTGRVQDFATQKVRTLWLNDLRSPEERGDKEKTPVEKLADFIRLDFVTLFSAIVIGAEMVKDIFPIIFGQIGAPMLD